MKPLKKLINAKNTSTKLRILADKVEKHKQFDQFSLDDCVVGIGNRLMGVPYGSREQFSNSFGLSYAEGFALFIAAYGMLGIGERNRRKLSLVKAQTAAKVLRKLAAKYAKAGN